MENLSTTIIVFLTTVVMYVISRLEQYQSAIDNILMIILLMFFMTVTFGILLPKLFNKKDKKPKSKKQDKIDNFTFTKNENIGEKR